MVVTTDIAMTSKDGRDFIKKFEGYKPRAYQDIAGVWTIGYGHTSRALDHAIRLAWEGEVQEPTGFFQLSGGAVEINEVKAEELMIQDLSHCEAKLTALFSDRLLQHETDALCSFLYNTGVGAFVPQTSPRTAGRARIVSRELELGDRGGGMAARAAKLRPLADALLWWDKSTIGGQKVRVRGLTRRRIEEAELLLYGDYALSDDGIVNAPGIAINATMLEWVD